MSYAGLCFASSAILLGLAKDSFEPISMVIGGIVFVISAGVASYSARPVNFYMPGACLSDLEEDLDNDTPMTTVLLELSSFAEKHININKSVLAENAGLLLHSQKLSVFAAIVASVPQALVYYFS